jgi:hypothetical protein
MVSCRGLRCRVGKRPAFLCHAPPPVLPVSEARAAPVALQAARHDGDWGGPVGFTHQLLCGASIRSDCILILDLFVWRHSV